MTSKALLLEGESSKIRKTNRVRDSLLSGVEEFWDILRLPGAECSSVIYTVLLLLFLVVF